jgi:ribosomal-protein-alanine N-acetyltransferase
MNPDHFSQVLAIENDCFGCPWSEDEFIKQVSSKRTIADVMFDDDGSIIGYYLIYKKKGYAELMNLAIRKDRQRQGLGLMIVKKLLDKHKSIKCYVSEANLSAHLFLKKCGFVATQVDKCFYSEVGLDAYLFECG